MHPEELYTAKRAVYSQKSYIQPKELYTARRAVNSQKSCKQPKELYTERRAVYCQESCKQRLIGKARCSNGIYFDSFINEGFGRYFTEFYLLSQTCHES